MTKFKLFGLFIAIISLSAFTKNSTLNWSIDEDYSIKFSSSKASGGFETFTGDVLFDENNLQDSRFDVQVDVKSIKTGNFMKNSHAKGKNWFDADQYPTIDFTSKEISKTTDGYEVTGTLSMHGVDKDFTMPFSFVNNTFETSFTVDRTDFNIGATTGMAKKVPHEIKLDISVPVVK